jgi:hypothetical protein
MAKSGNVCGYLGSHTLQNARCMRHPLKSIVPLIPDATLAARNAFGKEVTVDEQGIAPGFPGKNDAGRGGTGSGAIRGPAPLFSAERRRQTYRWIRDFGCSPGQPVIGGTISRREPRQPRPFARAPIPDGCSAHQN